MALSRYLNALKSMDDVAVELWWRRLPESAALPEPTWQLPHNLASDLRIGWPTVYHWEMTDHWMRHIFAAFCGLVPTDCLPLSQSAYTEATVVFEMVYQNATHRVVLDYSDYQDSICPASLDGAACYFKMQYRREGYGDSRIVPGGYPVSSPYMYRFLENLRRDADTKPKLYPVYGRFGLRYSAEIRQKAMDLLFDANIGYIGGTKFVRSSRFLRDMARTKIGINMPGNGDFCFRLMDYLSIGICVVGPKPRTELPVPLIDGQHVVFCKDDLSDLVPLCRGLLDDDVTRQQIARNARDYFDRYLHRDQIARYYLHQFLATRKQASGTQSRLHDVAPVRI